jgi:hypothetical protein
MLKAQIDQVTQVSQVDIKDLKKPDGKSTDLKTKEKSGAKI